MLSVRDGRGGPFYCVAVRGKEKNLRGEAGRGKDKNLRGGAKKRVNRLIQNKLAKVRKSNLRNCHWKLYNAY